MYDQTTRSYSLMDASRSYDWMVDGVENLAEYTDDELSEMLDMHIELSISNDTMKAENKAYEMEYPHHYPGDLKLETPEDWIAYEKNVIEQDHEDERESVLAWLKSERDKAKHAITPHKGGRDETISLRFTSDELALLDKARGGRSRSDYIMSVVKDDMHYNMPTEAEWNEAFADFQGEGQELVEEAKRAIERGKISAAEVLASLEGTQWVGSVFYLGLKNQARDRNNGFA